MALIVVSIAFCNSSSFNNGEVTTLIIALVTGIDIATFPTSILDFCNAKFNSFVTFSAFSKTLLSSGISIL